MAYFSQIKLQDLQINVWYIEESEDFFTDDIGFTSSIKNDIKRLEHVAGRFLLKKTIPGIDFNHISIPENRKPLLTCGMQQFSLSHSFPYIACSAHPQSSVGIDIQVIREKTLHIQDRFLHVLEAKKYRDNLMYTSIIWCAKEAMYKYLGTGGQEFKTDFLIQDIIKTEQPHIYDMKAVIYPDKAQAENILLRAHVYTDVIMAYTIPNQNF